MVFLWLSGYGSLFCPCSHLYIPIIRKIVELPPVILSNILKKQKKAENDVENERLENRIHGYSDMDMDMDMAKERKCSSSDFSIPFSYLERKSTISPGRKKKKKQYVDTTEWRQISQDKKNERGKTRRRNSPKSSPSFDTVFFFFLFFLGRTNSYSWLQSLLILSLT